MSAKHDGSGTVHATSRAEVAAVQQRLLESSPADMRSDWVDVKRSRIHFIEGGTGPPTILLHGSGNSSSDWIPLIEQQIGRTWLAIDRPGFGLSEPVEFPPDGIRTASVDFLNDLLDELDLEAADIVGNSGGGVLGLWMAIDCPSRVRSLALLGATPLLPGTTVPLPLRLMTSRLGGVLSRLMPGPSPETVIKMMGMMGEAESIARYPGLVDLYVAAGSDATAAEASSNEMEALVRGLRGFRPDLLFDHDELTRLRQPTLLIWGDRDPIGDDDAARRVNEILPNSELHLVAAGHAPWWSDPKGVAARLGDFYARL